MVCTDRRSPRWRGWTRSWWIAVALLAGLVAVAGLASAHTSDEHGTLTFHDEEDGEPTTSVACEFWVQGHNMTHGSGTIEMSHAMSGRDAHGHAVANWTGTADDNGTFSFELGPIEEHAHGSDVTRVRANLTGNHSTATYPIDHAECEDHERPLPGDDPHDCQGPTDVQAFLDGTTVVVTWEHHQDPSQTERYEVHRSEAGERNFSRIAKVDANETQHNDTTAEASTAYTYVVVAIDAQTQRAGHPCDHAQIETASADPPPCPENVQAQALEEGDVRLSWSESFEADSFKIYRATGNGSFGKLNAVQDPGYLDANTQADQTYRYRVVGANEAGESRDCPIVEATAIPSFPTFAALGLAAAGGVGAATILRRRP